MDYNPDFDKLYQSLNVSPERDAELTAAVVEIVNTGFMDALDTNVFNRGAMHTAAARVPKTMEEAYLIAFQLGACVDEAERILIEHLVYGTPIKQLMDERVTLSELSDARVTVKK